MAEEKPITIPAIIAAMKEAGFATQSDLQQMETRLKDHVHEQLTEFYAGHIEPKLQEMDERNQQQFQENKEGQKRLEERMKAVEVGQSHIRDDIKGLEGELAATPSRGEVENLKSRVARLEQTN